MAAKRASRREVIIGVGVLVVALVAVGAAVFIASRGSTDTAAGSGGSSSEIVDPPVTQPPAKIAPLPASDKAPSAAGIQAQLAGALANPALAQFTGVVIDPVTGATLFNQDSSAPQIPASTAKILTGAALLTSVDPTDRFTTKIVQGDQEGDIVLVGGGDVTLSARKDGVNTIYDGAPLMSDLAAQIKASGIDVKRIVLDTDYWTGPDLADGWQTADIRGTPGSAQGFITRDGRRKLLLVSKRDRQQEILIPGASGATLQVVDQSTQGRPARMETLSSETLRLPGYAVAVVTMP